MFLDHTQRRSTVGRTPLDEWSARRRDLYLTTHGTHKRQISMPPVGFEPTISLGKRPQTYALDRATAGTGTNVLWLIHGCRWWRKFVWSYVVLVERWQSTSGYGYVTLMTGDFGSTGVIYYWRWERILPRCYILQLHVRRDFFFVGLSCHLVAGKLTAKRIKILGEF